MQIANTTPTQGTDYVKDGVLYRGNVGGAVLVESAADLADLPPYAPGCVAHTPGWKAVWEMSPNGVWKNVVGGADVGDTQ